MPPERYAGRTDTDISNAADDRVVKAASAFVYKLISSNEDWNVAPALTEWLELQDALKEAVGFVPPYGDGCDFCSPEVPEDA